MPNGLIYNFFATREDVAGLWRWIASQPGMRMLEVDSRPDAPNREYQGFPEGEWIAETFLSIAAWPSIVGGNPRQRQIQFTPGTQRELQARGRTILESPAFIAIKKANPPKSDFIGPTELSYWTEKLVRKYGRFSQDQVDEVDWALLRKQVVQVQKHIKSLAVANWNSKPVLPGVAEKLREPSSRLWFWGAEGTI